MTEAPRAGRRGPGRRSKFSEEKAAQIVERIRNGATKRDAAGSVGVSEDTLARWAQRYADFAAQMALADSECAVLNAALVQKAARGYEVTKTKVTRYRDGSVAEVTETWKEWDWRAALEWLKRRRPQEWGDALKVQMIREAAEEVRALPPEDLLTEMGYQPDADGQRTESA